MDREQMVAKSLFVPCFHRIFTSFFSFLSTKYNKIYKVQMPDVTPLVCRHAFCSNMANSGMNPKTLQYIMGHSDIGVTLDTYTHIGYEDASRN